MNIISKPNHSHNLCASNYCSDYSLAKMLSHIPWTDFYTSPSRQFSLSNIPQMHPIRFPTPPTTPPKGPQEFTRLKVHQRTESVIMKIGQSQQASIDNVQYQNPTQTSDLDKFETDDSLNLISFGNFVCNWTNCKRLFENLTELASHVNKIHAISSSVDGLYYCQWDGCSRSDRGFNARYKMLVHVRTHTKEKPHQCHLCGKSFSRAENLKIHARSHSGEKPYVCTYEGCLKAYSNSSDRFKHSRTHSIEKPYLCKVPGCQKRYTDPSSLRKHVKTFRHAEQLINSAKHQTNTLKVSKVPDGDRSCIYSNIISNTTNCCNDHYILDVNSARIFCMEIDDMNYYYENKNPETDKLWLRSDDGMQYIKSRYILRDVDMDVNVEVPLDLRINRIV